MDVSHLSHGDIDLTITALEIYATAIRDEIEDQAENRIDTDDDDSAAELPFKANFDYDKRLHEVQELLGKYREILKNLLSA